MTAIIDYGVGNLFSLKSSLASIGVEAVVTNDIAVIRRADRLILPGVGAFADAASKLKYSGLDKIIIEEVNNGKALLGICLGMQLLFDKSYEYGEHEGLGLIKGSVKPFKDVLDKKYKIPHIGWNSLQITKSSSQIYKYIKNGDYVYFVHSYYAELSDNTIAKTEYGIDFTASVQNGNIFGCQFHPEKSGSVGLNILRGFCEIGGKENYVDSSCN